MKIKPVLSLSHCQAFHIIQLWAVKYCLKTKQTKKQTEPMTPTSPVVGNYTNKQNHDTFQKDSAKTQPKDFYISEEFTLPHFYLSSSPLSPQLFPLFFLCGNIKLWHCLTLSGRTHGILITGGQHRGLHAVLLVLQCSPNVPDRGGTPDLKLQGLMFPRLKTSNGRSDVSAMQRSRQKTHLKSHFFGVIHSWKHGTFQQALLMNVRSLAGKL